MYGRERESFVCVLISDFGSLMNFNIWIYLYWFVEIHRYQRSTNKLILFRSSLPEYEQWAQSANLCILFIRHSIEIYYCAQCTLYTYAYYVWCVLHAMQHAAYPMGLPLPITCPPLVPATVKMHDINWIIITWECNRMRIMQHKFVRSFALYAEKSTHFLMCTLYCTHIYRILIGLIDMDERRQSTQHIYEMLQQCAITILVCMQFCRTYVLYA